MADDVLAITWQVVDNGDFDHGVCSWLLFHAGTCNVDENLCREGGVVDLHVELEQLVVCRAAYALAYEVYAVTYVVECIYAVNGKYVCLVIGEIWVCLDCCGNLVDVCIFFQLNIYHAAVYAFAYRYCHGECVLDACLGLYAYAVSHAAAGTEIGVADALGCKGFHEGAYD